MTDQHNWPAMSVPQYIFARFRQYPLGFLRNVVSSTKFLLLHLLMVPRLKDRDTLFQHALSQLFSEGLILEFGVAKGASVNLIASLLPDKTVYGFDSFKGLPEDWGSHKRGHFKVEDLPTVLANVDLVVGLFQDTLESFLGDHTENIAFIHMDADLYSSTKYVLSTLANHHRLQEGTIIQFDNYFNYLGWWNGESKAFNEFVKEHHVDFKYCGYSVQPTSLQDPLGRVVIEIKKIQRL